MNELEPVDAESKPIDPQTIATLAPHYPIEDVLRLLRANRPAPAPVAPRAGFLDRFGAGLADIQSPGASGRAGDVFGANLLASAARGFGGNRVAARDAQLKAQMDAYTRANDARKQELAAQLTGVTKDYETRSTLAEKASSRTTKTNTDVTITPETARQYPRLKGLVGQPVSRSKYEDVVTEKPEKPADITDMNYKEVALGIHNNTLPPTIIGNRGTKEAMKVYAELQKLGDNLVVKQTEYAGLQKFYAGMNTEKTRTVRTTGTAALGALDKLQSLNDELDTVIKRSRVPIGNQAEFEVALHTGLLGPKAASLVQQVKAQTADARIMLGVIYGGGYAPNDAQVKQAIENLNAYWAPTTIRGAIGLGKSNITQRLNALNESQAFVPPGATNYQNLQPAQGKAIPQEWLK